MDEWDFPGKIHSRLSQIDGLCSVYMSQRVRENLKFSSGERGLSAAVDGFPLPQPSAASGVKGRGGETKRVGEGGSRGVYTERNAEILRGDYPERKYRGSSLRSE